MLTGPAFLHIGRMEKQDAPTVKHRHIKVRNTHTFDLEHVVYAVAIGSKRIGNVQAVFGNDSVASRGRINAAIVGRQDQLNAMGTRIGV